ncbi:hypothetical protein CBE01nite_41130 [Clostridium beijerinckii]|uniref:HK97 family phage prohead protease n=1 Tax=Clostridium beijerinckii TaxID=1520 RepID=A0AB74VF87_CLOBE|nr:HK97 family phage prohead protease [Clostridium beijerinckii]NRZ29426.1 HK97 family phage prohead protease [Clostridium beijerinckii]NYB94804.1 HK97 family phage prohead protease [Clostridium beijerinckii]OOM28040.1 caudovirus prohead protease [Clostridium beijerinckii]QUN35059.1 HK97 family phage prohead protease [Clostridium beijerinckii]SQA99952.1 phage prohead protease, HK97 family [Clostridium beijerinckii]
MEKQYNQNKLEVRELENGKLQLEILVNDFRESRMLQGKNGKFIENIKPEAFKKAIGSNANIELYVDHENYVNLADNMMLEVREDGLYAIVDLIPQARSLYNTIKEKGANGISFGFECLKDVWNGCKRTIEELKLFEISILMSKSPAYWGGYAEARSMIEIPQYDLCEMRKKRLELYKSI